MLARPSLSLEADEQQQIHQSDGCVWDLDGTPPRVVQHRFLYCYMLSGPFKEIAIF